MPARKPKTYVGRVYLGSECGVCDRCRAGKTEPGQQCWHWVGRFELKRDKDAAVAKAKTEKPWLKDPAGPVITADEWADRYLARMESGALLTRGGRRYKHSSIHTARGSLRHFREAFGDRPLGSITRVEAEDWAERVPTGAIPTVITLMNLAYRAELIDRNRFEGLSRRVEGRKHERPPSEEEMLLLLDGCSALGDYAPMMGALLTFGAFTLMRPCELFALDWPNVDLDAGANGRVLVSRRLYRGRMDLPKSNRVRTITLTPPARAELDALLKIPGYYPRGPVFRNKSGGPLTEPTLTAYWKEVRARCRIDRDFYSCTKHYGVHYMKVRLGLPDAVIAAQAGWSERAVTKMVETYGHAVDERRLMSWTRRSRRNLRRNRSRFRTESGVEPVRPITGRFRIGPHSR